MNVLKRAVILIAEISFDTFAAPLVQERQWCPSQEIKQLRNGGIELSLTLGNLEEIERWILACGSHAQVLAPAELKSQIGKDRVGPSRHLRQASLNVATSLGRRVA